MMADCVMMIDNGMVSYQSRPPRSSTVGMSTMIITENKQAIEMANIYSGVLANMTDAFASIVSNNLNNVMRIFTIISITLSIPTLIFSMYGMNFQEGMLGMPLTDKPWGFAVIIGISLVVSAIVTWFLTRSRMF